MADPRNMDEDELMMNLINTDGAKNNVQEDADDGSQYLALEQNEQQPTKKIARYFAAIAAL